jgi:predicted adenine nucleotide alpha hydrolase (AANH) superfamily ATPase
VPLLIDPPDHAAWLQAVRGLECEPEGGGRCQACFRHNLARAAAWLPDSGCETFATSLTISPRKCATDVIAAGRAVGGDAFLPVDFSRNGGFQRSVALSRQFGLYRQRDCGCEFSRRPDGKSAPGA